MYRLILILLICLSCTRPGLQAARINLQLPNGQAIGSGSGFAVRDSRGNVHLVTAGHVCEAALAAHTTMSLTFGVVGGTATGGEYYPKYIDLTHDLCALGELVDAGQQLDVLEFGERPAIGDPLTIVGAPYGVYPLTSDGIMIGWASHNRQTYLAGASPTVGPGNSGSPVMDAEGKVVGVLVLGYQFFFFAVPVEQLIAFLEAPY